MSRTVTQELMLLIALTAAGAGIGFFFDCYRLLRRHTKPGYLLTQLTDLLFWIVSAGLVFYVFLTLTGGEVRFFSILLIPTGMAIYLKLASPFVREPLGWGFQQMVRLFRFLLRVLVFCWHTVLFPFRFAVGMVSYTLQFTCGVLRLIFLPVRYAWRCLRRRFLEWWRRWKKP